MKKIFTFLLALIIVFSSCQFTFANDNPTFTTIKIPFPEEIEERKSWQTVARYKDSKQAIPLSMYYDGYVFATVPYENKDREIEAFIPDEIKFTDKDDSQYEFFVMEELSKTGVILGNEKGEADPFGNITRAEAVAMIMRFLGLKNEVNYQLNFDDVNRNDWYYGVIASAHKRNIVVGDSETSISPNRNVTRQELTVMAVRALKYADLRCPLRNIENIPCKMQGIFIFC
jgi:hypothetical protein